MRAIAYGCIRAVGLLPGVFAACGAVAPGEVAPTDVITPVPLVVVDPARTEAWRRQERERLPAVWRSDPEAAGRALNRLAELFAGARGDFVSEVASAFSKPVLEVAELNSPLFRQALLAFEQRHQQFPLSLELARLWALGASGDVVLDDWMEMLRRAVVAPMAADNDQVGDPTAAGSKLLLIRRDSSDAGLSLDLIERSGATVSASEVWTPTRARREWARLFPGADARVGTFLVGLLTVNCAPDPETTRRWHERRIEMIYAVDRYEAGAVLVRKGQIVDEKAARALREMSWRRRDEEPKPIEPVRTTPAPAPGPVLVRVAAPSQTERKRDFLGPAVVLVVVAGVSATMGLGWVSRRRSGSAIPQSRSAVLIMDDGETSWRGRALAAERRAERLGAVVKAGLAPILGHQFVQTLVAERSRMQEARRLAEEDVAELERRLDALHAPLTARLRAYEERIAELERELAARDKENSELLRTRVALTREKLAAAARGAR